MPRPRKPENDDLPVNLYEDRGYFTYIHPRTKERFPLGKIDRADAIDQANEVNRALDVPATLVQRVAAATPKPGTLADFLPTYRVQLETAELAAITRYHRGRHLKAIQKVLGDVEIGPTPEQGAEVQRRTSVFLHAYAGAGKRRMAKAMRATLTDLYAAMCSGGLLTINPAKQVTNLPPVKVNRERLTLDAFRRIYEAAAELDPWVQRSMALALVTLQRREDLAAMTFRDIDGRLKVEQRKTGARLRIPLELRLQALGKTVGDVIADCRDAVLSRHVLHHTSHQGRAKPGDPVHPQTLTTAFAEARKRAGVTAEDGKKPPSFHELRSLGARLYKQQGYDPQALLGHKQASTTATYLDDRGAEWVDVAA